jgi:glyoxylase-like metal-dependent hydrolase (beta-lactamase superfamily II)
MRMKYTTVLPLPADLGGFKVFFNAAAVRYDGGLVLVDVGFPGFLQILEETMASAGLKLADVKKIVITHCDGDHAGGLKAVVDRYPGIEILSSAQQAAYLTGKEENPRIRAAEKRYAACVTEEEKKAVADDIDRLKGQETVGKVTAAKDGQSLDGGIEIIEVAGHMPGHVCVYVKADKVLISGDALTSDNGRLCPPSEMFTLDMPAAISSLEKLLDYDIEQILCYHGGLVTGNIRQRLKEVIDNYKK